MKAKLILKKAAIYFLIAAFVVFIGLIVMTLKDNKKYNDYTSFSAAPHGEKALYLLADKMGYNALRFKKTVRFMPDGVTMVVIQPDTDTLYDDIEIKYLKMWLEKGNSLMLIGDDNNNFNKLQEKLNAASERNDSSPLNWSIYKVGQGKIFVSYGLESFLNGGLNDSDGAVSFIDVLDKIGSKTVYFNEYYHNLGEGLTIRDIIGFPGELAIFQIILALIVLYFAVSKRFGKPVTVFEIIKRKENENIYALSNIYKSSKANSYVLDVMFRRLKRDLAKYFGMDSMPENDELISAASNDGRAANMDLKSGFVRCENYINRDSKNMQEFIYLATWIEKIREEIV
ncbi:MAG: DUF4350 domain-containing protein [Bacillota bacterium]|nr:DUF4350 domain-containing protein [Bacillota bacterium]